MRPVGGATMNAVCEVCGDIGYEHLLLCCSDCKGGHKHQYCLDKVLFDSTLEDWFCDKCKQRHNKGSHSRSLEKVSSERPSNHSRFESTLQQPITNRPESAMVVGTWGQRKRRSTVVGANLKKEHSNLGPKKRRRLILITGDEDEEEDKTEDVQQENVNEQPLKCNEPMMKHRINTRYYVEEAVQTGNINGRPMKRRRYIAEKEDEEDIEGVECALNNVSKGSSDDRPKMASQTPDQTDHSLQSRPSDSKCADRQYHICSQPLDEPVWSGVFKIDNKVFLKLDAHLSNKACQRVHEMSGLLQPVVEVRTLSRLQAWPKRWISSGPTGENVGLLFLPHSSMQNEDLTKLINRIIKSDDALQVTVGIVELLIFPSVLLAEQFQFFQGKHYLWGVFRKRKDNLDNGVLVEEQDVSTHVTGEGRHPEHNLLVQRDEALYEKMLPVLEKDQLAMTEKASQNDALKAKNDAPQCQALQSQVEEIPGLRSQVKALGDVGTAVRDEKAELEPELKPTRSELEKCQIELKSLRERIQTLQEKAWLGSEERHKDAITAFKVEQEKMIRDKSAQDSEINTYHADLEKFKSQVESCKHQPQAEIEKEATVHNEDSYSRFIGKVSSERPSNHAKFDSISQQTDTTGINVAAPAPPQSPAAGITQDLGLPSHVQTKVITHNQLVPEQEHDPPSGSDGRGRASQEQGRRLQPMVPDRVWQCADGHRDARTSVRSSKTNKELTFEQVSRHFSMPIEQAAREMNMGVTLLKKQCRKLGITRWPHQKLKSLQKVIDTLQGLGKESAQEDVVEFLQLTKKMIQEKPNMVLDQRTKQLRHVLNKERYKRKRS